MSFYRSLTFDHTQVPSDQTNFPVLFQGLFSYLATVANGGKVQNASGYDIYFSTDTSGEAVLPFERVHWNATTGACEFWIQVPTLTHSASLVIYLQYGNATISTDQSNTTGTWDSNYVGVYHFGDGTTLNVNDSTGNANNGTAVNTPTAVNDGIGGSGSGGGGSVGFAETSDQYINLGTGSSLNITGNLTLEAWAKITTGGLTFDAIVSNLDASSQNGYFFFIGISGADGGLNLCNAGAAKGASGRSVTVTNWQYYVGTYDTSNIRFYTDATLDATTAAASAIGSAAGQAAYIGSYITSGFQFNGSIDEVRISKTNRSADWITTQYNMTHSPSGFVSIGSEQVGATPINENLSDSFTFSDSIAELFNLGFAPADTNASNWGDAIAFNLQIPGIGFIDDQSGNWGDALALEMNFNPTFSDGFIFNDFQQPASTMDAFNDTLALSDSSFAQLEIQVPLGDSFTWTDSTLVVGSVLVHESDQFTWTDVVAYYVPLYLMFTDFFIWRDGQTVKWSSVLPPLSDQLVLSDGVIVNNAPFWTPVNELLSDTLALSDTIQLQSLVTFSLSDDFAFSDRVQDANVYNPFNQLFTENLDYYQDSVLYILEGELLQFADSFTFNDSVLVTNGTSFNNYIRRYLNDEPT